MPALAAFLLASVVVMTLAAAREIPSLSAAAAGAFAIAAVGVGLVTNRPYHRDSPPGSEAIAARRNARLMMLVYAWGGTAMLAVYTLSGLKWRHGWQYGAGMALISAAILLYVHRLGQAGSPLATAPALASVRHLTLAQGLGAAAGLVFLISSGKLWAGKTDWAANHVFLFGGLAIAALSAIALATARRLAPVS